MRVLHLDGSVAIGEVENVMLVGWLTPTTIAMVERLDAAAQAFQAAAAQGGKYTF